MHRIQYSLTDRKRLSTEGTGTKSYACTQLSDVVSFNDFARHVASHGTTYSRADVLAVFTLVVDCLLEMLSDGKKVQLGELGSFYPMISSKGADTATDFTADNIRKLYAVWERGEDFKDFSRGVTFVYTPTRAAQKAVAKAQKAGESIVDISKAAGTSTGTAGTVSGGNGSGTGTGNGSGSEPGNTPTGGGSTPSGDGDED